MKYTTEEVIQLKADFDQYEIDVAENNSNKLLNFKEWLLEKEQSLLPKKGDIILVRDHETNPWKEKIFCYLDNDPLYPVVCESSENPNSGVKIGWKYWKLKE